MNLGALAAGMVIISPVLGLRPVRWIDQVLEAALERIPEPLDEAKLAEAAKPPEAVDTAAVRTH